MQTVRTIEIEPTLVRRQDAVSVGFTASAGDETFHVDFTIEQAVEPTEVAVSEAVLLAGLGVLIG